MYVICAFVGIKLSIGGRGRGPDAKGSEVKSRLATASNNLRIVIATYIFQINEQMWHQSLAEGAEAR